MKRTLALILILISSSACTQQFEPSVSQVKTEVIPWDRHILPLGTGYNSTVGVFTNKADNRCLDFQKIEGQPVYTNFRNEKLTVNAGLDFSEHIDSYELTTEAKASAPMQFGEMSSSLKLVNTERKISTFTTYSLSAGNTILLNPQLSSRGQELSDLDTPLAPLRRYAACGDEYVYQIELGAKAHVGMQYYFASNEMKAAFSAAFGVKVGPAKKSLFSASMAESLKNVVGVAAIVFYQEGGSQQAYQDRLEDLPRSCRFSIEVKQETGAGDDVDPDNPDDTIPERYSATLKGIDDCARKYQELVDNYILGTSPQSLPSQIKDIRNLKDDIGASGLVPLKYFTKSYRKSGYMKFAKAGDAVPAELKDFTKTYVRPFVDFAQKISRRYNEVEPYFRALPVSKTGPLLESLGMETPDPIAFGQTLNKVDQLLKEVEDVTTNCRGDYSSTYQQFLTQGGTGSVDTTALDACRQKINTLKNSLEEHAGVLL